MMKAIWSKLPLRIKSSVGLFLICHALINIPLAGQNPGEKKSFRDRLFFGGNFGLQMGTITNIEVSPLAGYYVTTRFAPGIGLRYQYYRDSYGIETFSTHIYGGSIFARYDIIRDLGNIFRRASGASVFMHVEYEILSLEKRYFAFPPTTEEGRFAEHSVLAGGGLRQPIGKRAAIIIEVLWNLNESPTSPYNNPVIRFGFTF